MDELRIVLLGKQGVGKSASGNTLLGKNPFQTGVTSKRVTQICSVDMSTVDNQKIRVIDTPGWSDSSLSETEIKQEILKCIDMSSPGPHVFLLVLPIGRFTNEEINTVMNILEEFGDKVNKYMIVLFTRGDDLEERSIEDYLEELHPDLKKLIQICCGRYHVFNNKDKQNQSQVSSLLQRIKHMVEGNNNKFYTIDMYQKAKDQQTEERRRQKEAKNLVLEKSNKPLENKKQVQNYGEIEQKDLKNNGEKKQREREKHHRQKEREDTSENITAQPQKSTQDRKHILEKEKGTLETKQEELKNKMETQDDERKKRDDYNVDAQNEEKGDTLEDRTELDQLRLKVDMLHESIKVKEFEWSEENSRLRRERDQLREKVQMQEKEIERMNCKLQKGKQKLCQYEELKKENKQQDEIIKKLQQEIHDVKRQSRALITNADLLEKKMTDDKIPNETKSNMLSEFISSLRKFFK